MTKLDTAKEINEYRPKNRTFQREKQVKRPVRTKQNHEKTVCITNLPRSTSMQIFCTKPSQVDDSKRFNSLINQKAKNQIARKTENLAVLINNGSDKSQSKFRKSKMFEVGSSSSMDSDLAENGNLLNTGCLLINRSSAANDSIRKVRSSPCIADEVPEVGNCSGAESLPNLSPKLKAKKSGYCPSDSGSSTTTEQSGWISSRYTFLILLKCLFKYYHVFWYVCTFFKSYRKYCRSNNRMVRVLHMFEVPLFLRIDE